MGPALDNQFLHASDIRHPTSDIYFLAGRGLFVSPANINVALLFWGGEWRWRGNALCLVGGFIGVILGAGGALLVALAANWPPLISIWTILLAFGFSALVGVFFGLYPASRAASLSPAEALRHL